MNSLDRRRPPKLPSANGSRRREGMLIQVAAAGWLGADSSIRPWQWMTPSVGDALFS